jgi:hypothetical protein
MIVAQNSQRETLIQAVDSLKDFLIRRAASSDELLSFESFSSLVELFVSLSNFLIASFQSSEVATDIHHP